MKSQYRWGNAEKEGLGQFADLRDMGGGGVSAGYRQVVFEGVGVNTPMHTMSTGDFSKKSFLLLIFLRNPFGRT